MLTCSEFFKTSIHHIRKNVYAHSNCYISLAIREKNLHGWSMIVR